MKTHIIIISILMLILSSCSKEQEKRATYEVLFVGNWKEGTHQNDVPPNAHFSKAVGMVHKSGVSLFESNDVASDGIEEMAETGATSILQKEIEKIIDNGNAYKFIDGEQLKYGTEIKRFTIKVHRDYPYATIVSMLAPSPDWFIAAENVELHNGKEFIKSIVVESVLYDAGTDSGKEFVSANEDSNPAMKIFKIDTLPSGNEVHVPFAWFRFNKVD